MEAPSRQDGGGRALDAVLAGVGIPTERSLPAWVEATARSSWGPKISWDELRSWKASEAADYLERQAVSEGHAARVRAILRGVAEVAGRMSGAGLEEIVKRYLVEVIQRPTVNRSSTCMFHFRVLAAIWPSLRKGARVSAMVKGLAMVNPLAPERAGVQLDRVFDAKGVIEAASALLRTGTRSGALVVQAVANVLAGARLTETIRDMREHENKWTMEPLTDGRTVIWIEQNRPKDDMMGIQAKLRPKVVVVPEGWSAAAPCHVSLEAGEEAAIQRMAGALIRTAGGVKSVTVARRAAASDTQRLVTEMGLEAIEALERVRDVLGHRPQSPSTWRYLPSRLGPGSAEVLRKAAIGRANER